MNNELTFEEWWGARASDFAGCTGIMQTFFKELAEQGWNAGRIALLKQWELDREETLSGCNKDS